MFPAEMAGAESAIADDTLRGVFAVFECAADFLGGHATSDGECEFDGRGREDVQGGERG